MAIRMNDSQGVDAVGSALAAIVSRRAAAGAPVKVHRSGGRPPKPSFDVAGPHRVYSIGLDEAGGPGMLERAEIGGSRHFVFEGDRPVAMAQLSEDGSHLTSVTFGSLAESMLRAIRVAEVLPEVLAADFELRVVEIAGIYLIALWLVGEESAILIPLDPAPWPLTGDQPYTVEAFESAAAQAVDAKPRREGERS